MDKRLDSLNSLCIDGCGESLEELGFKVDGDVLLWKPMNMPTPVFGTSITVIPTRGNRMGFENGGIVGGGGSTGEFVMQCSCGMCHRPTGAPKIEGEFVICNACSIKHFGLDRRKEEEEKRLSVLTPQEKQWLEDGRAKDYDTGLFNADH